MNLRWNANNLAAAFVALYLLSRFFFKPSINTAKNQYASAKYKGKTWRSDRTVAVRTVAETRFARCDIHTVSSEDGQKYPIKKLTQ